MTVKFKKLQKTSKAPTKATEGSAGWDLYVQRISGTVCYTGIAVEIPKDNVGLLFPRSSVVKKGLILANCVGVIDSDFRGEITLAFYKLDWDNNDGYSVGDRCGQLLILPNINMPFEEVNILTPTARGEGGFGSTGD